MAEEAPVQINEYGAVPPSGVTSIEPVAAPKHFTLTCVSVAESEAAGSVTMIFPLLAEQPLLSVTITE